MFAIAVLLLARDDKQKRWKVDTWSWGSCGR